MGQEASVLYANSCTAALQEQYISPRVAQFADAAPDADLAKSAELVQRDAGGIFGKDSSL
jgi:hypothetical protein